MSKPQFYRIMAALCIAGYSYLGFKWFQVSKVASSETTFCPLKATTGIPCPACGTTRSVMAIIEGNLEKALITNPTGFIAFGVLIISPLGLTLDWVTKKSSFFRFYQYFEHHVKRKVFAIPLITLILANWIWNIFKEL